MYYDENLTAKELRKTKDRVIFLNEFAIAYGEPLECDSHRGYFGIYVTYEHTQNDNPEYEQEFYISGDNNMILEYFYKSAKDGLEYFERFLE